MEQRVRGNNVLTLKAIMAVDKNRRNLLSAGKIAAAAIGMAAKSRGGSKKVLRKPKAAGKSRRKKLKRVEQKASKEWDGCLKTVIKIPGKKLPRWTEKFAATLQRSVDHTNASGSITLVTGRVKLNTIGTFNTRSEIQTHFGATEDRGIWQGYVNNQMFTNTSNASIFITAYSCVPKRDNDLDALDTWTDVASIKGVAARPTTYFTSPTDFPGFSKMWRIIRKERVCLAPGMVWNLKISHFPNKFIQPPWVSTTYSTEHLRKLTSSTFICAHGPPLNDSVLTSSEISLGFTQKLDWVSSIQYFFYRIPQNPKTYAVAENLVSSYTNTVQIMGEDDDTVKFGVNA